MSPSIIFSARRLPLFAAPLLSLTISATGADRFWDGGAVNIGTNGDGLSTYTGGTWNTALTNWDQGNGQAHVAWDNLALDNAVFAGTYAATGTKTVDLTADVIVNQIRVLAGSTGGNRYDIGVAGETNAVTFGGTYSDALPALLASNAATATGHNMNFNARITGAISGGLVVSFQGNITTPGTSGRLSFTNTANDFTGDVTLLNGNLAAGASLGAAANDLILKGGALFVSGGAAATTTFSRDMQVAAASGIGTNATSAGLQLLDITSIVTGSGNLTRYSNVTGTAISEVRFSGDMSGYTGVIENTGGTAANNLITIQSTVPSAGAWRLTGGTLKLNTAVNDAAIANGAGASDLLMNGGTLDLNGKLETINGLSGATGFVQNQLSATASTLTLGDGNATATFGGTIRNNSGTGGTLGLTKIGSGTQTLGGTNTYSGITTVSQGALLISGSLTLSNLDVSATLGGSGTVDGSASLSGGTIDPGGDGGDRSLTMNGGITGSGVIALTIDSTTAYDRILGTGLLDTTNISLSVTMNDTGWTAASDAAGLATATRYDIVANPVTGSFTNGILLTPAEQAYWGVGAGSRFFNFGGQDFLLTAGSYSLTAITPIPEPSLIALIFAAGLVANRRRR
jgi:autotransporter-associated beta strand protein